MLLLPPAFRLDIFLASEFAADWHDINTDGVAKISLHYYLQFYC